MKKTPPAKPPAKHSAKPAAKTTPGQLRIVGGLFKRTPLPIAAVDGLRPTPERLRETLFNWLGGDAAGLRCLDLFAGTGALGFEAASRGAAFVLLNEWQRSAHAQLQKSAALLKSRQGGEDLQLDIRQQDGLALLKNWQGEAFDVLFLDPPFAQEASYATALRAAQGKAASVYLEASRQWSDAELNALGWQAAKHSRAGAVHGHLLRPVSAPQVASALMD